VPCGCLPVRTQIATAGGVEGFPLPNMGAASKRGSSHTRQSLGNSVKATWNSHTQALLALLHNIIDNDGCGVSNKTYVIFIHGSESSPRLLISGRPSDRATRPRHGPPDTGLHPRIVVTRGATLGSQLARLGPRKNTVSWFPFVSLLSSGPPTTQPQPKTALRIFGTPLSIPCGTGIG
jgi:hypothetical protein